MIIAFIAITLAYIACFKDAADYSDRLKHFTSTYVMHFVWLCTTFGIILFVKEFNTLKAIMIVCIGIYSIANFGYLYGHNRPPEASKLWPVLYGLNTLATLALAICLTFLK